jgi:hypothetical protein
MAQTITLTAAHLYTLDLSPALSLLEPLAGGPELGLRFDIQLDRDPTDPRELSEIPEVRLWFIRLDSRYPWLPLVLDWEAGELARYAAMLVPHQFSPSEGIRYNPEALEIFIMQKIFVISAWLQAQGLGGTGKLKLMAKMLGYDIEEGLFDLLR